MISALTTLTPIFFMIVLGYVSKCMYWITPEQKNGANTIVFNLLFPIMIFNLLASTQIEADILPMTLFILAAYFLFFFLGKSVFKKWLAPYERISPYLLTTAEGGNLALPLFVSLVPGSGDTVLLDLAGVIFCFVCIPILMSVFSSTRQSPKEIIKNIVTNPFVISAFLGIFFNLTGLYQWIEGSSFKTIYEGTLAMATAPIISMILFIIGYNLDFSWNLIQPAIKFVGLRIVLFACIIAGFFILFPERMADQAFMMAVLIYFMGPVGFGVVMQISPLMKNQKDESFASGVISLNIIFVLIIYVILVLMQNL
ncbi:AEC family transporter [Ileibacterium valens]|uniref:AEC family transporter n=1 Tax=Ileibacterium valens TaxID=1862668 RepID=UPI002729FA5E|nr:AEC family transporter [Ileibacterium valens]